MKFRVSRRRFDLDKENMFVSSMALEGEEVNGIY